MKIALYIEDGIDQIVLTPQSETEKGILAKIGDSGKVLEIKRGSFHECRGGWVRQFDSNDSTILVLRTKLPEPA